MVEFLSLKVFKMRLDTVLDNLFRLPFPQEAGPDGVSRSLPTWAFLRFCDTYQHIRY